MGIYILVKPEKISFRQIASKFTISVKYITANLGKYYFWKF